jgi:hypothetical protein
VDGHCIDAQDSAINGDITVDGDAGDGAFIQKAAEGADVAGAEFDFVFGVGNDEEGCGRLYFLQKIRNCNSQISVSV